MIKNQVGNSATQGFFGACIRAMDTDHQKMIEVGNPNKNIMMQHT